MRKKKELESIVKGMRGIVNILNRGTIGGPIAIGVRGLSVGRRVRRE